MKKSELQEAEYKEFYATYLNAIGEVELIQELVKGKNQFSEFIQNLNPSKLSYAYGKDKWTIAEVLMHIIDTERVFQYRALCFSRKDKTALPGFNENDYVNEGRVKGRSKESLLQEFIAVRESTISLFTNLSSEQLLYTGKASNIQWSVGGLGFVACGHQKHHAKILEERYF